VISFTEIKNNHMNNKLNFMPSVLLVGALSFMQPILAQPSVKDDSKKTVTSNDNEKRKDIAFIDRYYDIKETYPSMSEIHATFAAASISKEKYMERYNAIKAAYPKLKSVWANYAGSDHSLETFAKRYYEIKDTYPDMDKYYGDFAACKKSLPKFIERYNAIKASSPDLTDCRGQYAASDNTLTEFTKRYYGIKDSNTGIAKNAYAEYAGASNELASK
jgi:hypothetical protein